MKSTVSILRNIIRQSLGALIPEGSKVALVDFPNHPNVGDSAIWLGEIAYLTERKCRIAYVCDARTYCADALRSAIGDGMILIHGGGNFGDLYPLHQNLRERISSEFPQNTIVQLPQSIHFSDFENESAAFSRFARHPKFHLVTRDQSSFDIARRHLPEQTTLCPDMALMLDIPDFSLGKKTTSVVVLSREDCERAVDVPPKEVGNIDSIVCDWLSESVPRREKLNLWVHNRLSWGNSKIPSCCLNLAARFTSNSMAKERLDRGLGVLNRGKIVVTDRLHALILSWLGNSEVIYIDNSYRKLSNFIETWVKDSPQLHRSESFAEAMHLAEACTKRGAPQGGSI